MTTTEDRLLQSQSSTLRSSMTAAERTYISKQSEFEQQRPQLIKDYSNQWVLFENNQVLDMDFNYQTLLERVKQTKKN
ncbi:hypothetical protein [Aphanothece hegewaldii]|nr:hypothetical protein [Aphanothece hegewaldii]